MSLLTDDIRGYLGSTAVYVAPEMMGAAAGRYFGLAIGDDNPLYSDPDFARAQGLSDVTWPLTLICETNQYAGLPIAADGYAGHVWDFEVPGTRKVRGGNSYVFHRRIRPTDRITATWTVTDMQEKTTSRGEDMLVVTSTAVYTDAVGETVAENVETVIFVAVRAS